MNHMLFMSSDSISLQNNNYRKAPWQHAALISKFKMNFSELHSLSYTVSRGKVNIPDFQGMQRKLR